MKSRFHVISVKTPRRKKPVEPEPVAYERQQEMECASRLQKRVQAYTDKGLKTVGVRFAADPGKVYTYLVPGHVEHWLGMEVVVENDRGLSRVAYIVRVDDEVKLPDPTEYDDELKHVRGVVHPYED